MFSAQGSTAREVVGLRFEGKPVGLLTQCSFLLNHVDGEGVLVCGRGGRDALGESTVKDWRRMAGKDRCASGLGLRRYTIDFEEKRGRKED